MSLILKNKFFPSFNDDYFANDFFQNYFDQSTNVSMPAVNISEDSEQFKIELAAPGLDKNDFKIEIKNNVLTISSEKEQKHEENNEKYMRKEFNYCSFRRSFGLPQTANSEKIEAKHSNGILNITIPKRDEAKEKPMRQIEIK
ncbi:MAG: Hsp20/alpha crystallin family protein [Bacteroidales bacterium]|nr:Hsp20/alpha crystallin family protein [Bacteroidales bacterium]